MLGDDSRGDGDPALELFGNSITPNLHALVQRFPLLDHVYANSEASIDGHYWTAAGAVSDYVTKNWHQNYAGRKRPYDFGAYEVSAPPKGYIFQRMLESGVSFYNYGEALAGHLALPRQGPDPRADGRERPGPRPDQDGCSGRWRLLRQRHLDLRYPGDRPEGRERLRLEPAAGIQAR